MLTGFGGKVAVTSPLPGYVRNGIYTIDEVLRHVTFDHPIKKKTLLVDFDGDLMDMSSMRYLVFKMKGIECVVCGIVGSYFAKEYDAKIPRVEGRPLKWHFNLYAMGVDGAEVLMTKDHIFPVSHGGGNGLRNFQTMCSVCNGVKGGNALLG